MKKNSRVILLASLICTLLFFSYLSAALAASKPQSARYSIYLPLVLKQGAFPPAPTQTPTSTKTTTPTVSYSNTPTPTNTFTSTFTPTYTPTKTLTPTNSYTATATFTASATPTRTPTHTRTSTATATATSTFTDTPTQTLVPTNTSTLLQAPTQEPPDIPTATTGARLPVVNVPATINANTTWTAGNVYVISGQTTVNAGVTLTLDAGVIVKFQNSGNTKGKLIVNGTLPAQGTASNPIIFTSIHDDSFGGDTNNNGGATHANAGDWDGILFGSTSTSSIFNYAQVLYGGADGNIAVNGSNLALQNSRSAYSATNGLRWMNAAGGNITNTLVEHSLTYGLYLSGSSAPVIGGDLFADNRSYAVYMEANSMPAFASNSAHGNLYNGIGVYGSLGSGTWGGNLPYIATQNLTLPSSSTLTLNPATVVKFQSNTSFIVQGALVANGTTANPIVFTSIADDAYGGDTRQDGAAIKAKPGDWGTIYFADTSDDATSSLDHVEINYGGAGYNYGSGTAYSDLTLDSASPNVTNNRFEQSSAYGVQMLNASSPLFQGNRVNDNANHGLWIGPSSEPQVLDNIFTHNTGYAIYVSDNSQAIFGGDSATGNKVNGIGITGSINYDSTWEADLPYVVEGTLTLNLNTSLTIQPGVIVKLAQGASLNLNGALMAQGTADNRINFTSVKDDSLGGDTNGDETWTAPAAGDWNAITFNSTAGASVLDYVTVRYGGSNASTGALYLNGASPALGHLIVMGSQYRGIYTFNASPVLDGVVLAQNVYGLYNGTNSYPSVTNSDIYSNTSYGIYNSFSSYTIPAINDWWGIWTGPTHSGNLYGSGDRVSDYVSYAPFADTEPVPLPPALPIFPPAPVYTQVSGAITTNTTWMLARSPYLVTGDVTVNAGVQLTVEAGVLVKFQAGRNLNINGILSAVGTSGNPILFTSIKDDSVGGDANGDGSATSAKAGDWGAILFNDSSVDALDKLQFAQVRYGGSSGYALLTDSASPNISDNTFSNNGGYAILARNASAPTIARNLVLDNTGGGIQLQTTSNPTITNNQFWGNMGYAIYMDASDYPTLSGNIAYYNQRNAVRVAGTVTFNQSWYPNLDYVIEGTLTINSGVALTVQPGTTVKFNDTGSGITVNGALIANGSAAAHITFTSLRDESLGHDVMNQSSAGAPEPPQGYTPPGSASTIDSVQAAPGYWPLPGDWGRIYYADSSDDAHNVLNYVTVHYGGYGYNQAVYVYSAAPKITNSDISFNSSHGLYLDQQSNPLVDTNTFIQNGLSGIYITNSSSPNVKNSTFKRNGAYAVEMTAESKPRFSGNSASDNAFNGVHVWGTTAGATTWDANLTYVAGGVTIPSDSSLTLSPGVVVKFIAGTNWTVNGPFVANSTTSSRIILTSIKDDDYGGDTNNDGGAYTPASGDWGTLTFNSTSAASSITNSSIRFGGSPVVKVNATAVNLDLNNWYFNSGGLDISTADQNSKPVDGNIFEANRSYAINTDVTNFYTITNNNTFVNNIGNSIRVSGYNTLPQDTTLISGAVYWLDSWTIPTGVTLTVPANTIIKLSSGTTITVAGTLNGQGTAGNPVVFTSIKDDSVGGDTDATANLPAKGDWSAIYIHNGTVNLDYATLRYAGNGSCSGAITQYCYSGIFNAAISINHSTLSDNGKPAVYLLNGSNISGSISLLNSSIQNNNGYGIVVCNGFPVTIDNSTISGNAISGVYVYSSSNLISLTNSILNNNGGYAAELRLSSGNTLAISGNQGSGNFYNAIYMDGITNNDITLTPQGSLVYQFGNITVPTGKTMSLQPNTIVKFNGSLVEVDGTLNAQGSAGNPVVFTSIKDDSVGGDTDATANLPAKGDWSAIYIHNGTVNLDYATLRYAGNGSCSGAITQYCYSGIFNAAISINHSTLSDNGKPAVYLLNGSNISGSISLLNSSIQNNNGYGIVVCNGFPVTIDNSTISGNAISGVYVYSSSNLISLTNSILNNNGGYAAELRLSSGNTLAISGNQGSGNFYNAIYMDGTTNNDITLTPQGSLVYQFGNITVPTGKTMSLQPNTIVKFNSSLIEVDGTLNAQGSAGNPVVFTSIKDDSVGGDTDATANLPAKGDWSAIYIHNGTVNLDYATLRYAGNGSCSGAITQYCYSGIFNAAISINHSTLSDNGKPAVYLLNGSNISGSISLLNSSIQNNNGYGIVVCNGFPVTIDNSTISGNAISGVYVYSSSNLISLTNSILNNNGGYAAELRLSSGNTLAISGNQGSGNFYNAIYMDGTTNNDITLTPQGSLVYQFGNITVPTGKTMSLQPNTIVKFNSSLIEVDGTLNAQGSAGNPVVFTSIKDDSVGGDTDATANLPAKGDWSAIYIHNGTVNLDYATLRYAGNGSCSGAITQYCYSGIFNATISINHSTLSDNGKPAVYLLNGSNISASAGVHNSNIYNNTNYGVFSNFSPGVVDARNNWWGSDSGPAPRGTGDATNYLTYTCGTPPVTCYDFDYYVDAFPWIGMSSYYGQYNPWQAYVAEPVNTATGNYSYEHTDLSISTRSLPLSFGRSYNSAAPQAGRLGYGWTYSYNVFISESGANSAASVSYGDGRTIRFEWDGTTYVAPAGTFSTLTKSGSQFTLTEKDQTIYTFDSLDRLSTIADRNGNVTSLTYYGTLLGLVTAPDGRNLTLHYDASDRLDLVTDPAGRTLGFSYDASGNLATSTDARGKVTTYAYDTNHRLTSITDANGHTFVTNTYNSDGRVIQQLDASGDTTVFAYDTAAHKTTVTDPLGATIYQYDATLRLTSVTDPLNHTESYTYDAANNRLSLTDKRGNATNYTYDGHGNLLTTTDPLTGITTNTYDGKNNLLTSTDALNHTTTFTFDADNNLISKTVSPDGVANYMYLYTYYSDASRNGLLKTQTDPRNLVTSYDYNAHGDNTSILDAAGQTSIRTYDTAGRLLTSADPLGHTTAYTYNENNQVLTVTDPEAGVSTNTYDEVGNLLTTQDPNGHVTTRTYTLKDQLETVQDAAGYTSTYGYDALGNRTSVTDGNSHTSHYTYDAASRLVGVTDPLGKTTTYGYDENGNRISVTDANSHTTTYTFDKLNRQTDGSDALTHTTHTEYDLVGNVKSVTDANNHATLYDYDNLNRLIKVTDALSGSVTYTYDEDGNRKTMADANNHTTTYTYDALNRLHTETDPLSHVWTYNYDETGRRTSRVDANNLTTTYTYDKADRLKSLSAPSISVSYTYDAAGNRKSMVDATGTTTYTYDEINRPISVVQPEGTITYAYDAVNRISLTLPGSLTTTYTYDAANHLTDVTDWSSRITHYTYDSASRLMTTTYPNGVVTTNTYDIADRLTGITTMKDATTILAITYALDNAGNHKSMVDSSGTTTYTYDELNRLKSAVYPAGSPVSVSYTYDPMGNRKTMVQDGVTTSYTYDAADRLTGTAGGSVASFTWDNNGQMLTKGSQTFTWDTLGRMTGLTNGGTTASYVYNGDGVRIGRTVSGTATTYLQDLAAGLPVVMAETTGAATTEYVYGSDLIAQVNGSTPIYYHADGLGSTRVTTDSTGTSTDQYTYDAFGSTRSHVGTSANTFTFTGEQNDPEAGMVFLRARYYDPSLGVFLSSDSFDGNTSNILSLNLYLYTKDNPVNLVDPGGHDSCALFSCDTWYQFGQWSAKHDAEIKAVATAVGFVPIAGTLVKNDILAATGKMSTTELVVRQVAAVPGAILDTATFGGSNILNLSKGAEAALAAADYLTIPGAEASLYLTGEQGFSESALNAGTGLLSHLVGDEVGNALFPRGRGATPIYNWFGPVGRSILGKYFVGKLFDLGGEKASEALFRYIQSMQSRNGFYGSSIGGGGGGGGAGGGPPCSR